MVIWILAVLALYLVQINLPATFRVLQDGVLSYVGSRDNETTLSAYGQRAERAQRNLEESLFVFLSLGLLLVALDKQTEQAVLGAEVFFFARVLYVPLYVAAVPWIRSLVWVVGLGGLIAMVMPLVG